MVPQPTPPSFGGALQLAAVAPIPVLVRHAPAGPSPGAYAATLVPAMPTAIGPTVSYRPAEGAPGNYGYSILFDFGYGGTSPLACAGPPEPPSATPAALLPSHLVVTGAFCYGGTTVNAATGYLDGVPSVDNPEFRVLVRDLTLVLLQPREERGEGCRFIGC